MDDAVVATDNKLIHPVGIGSLTYWRHNSNTGINHFRHQSFQA